MFKPYPILSVIGGEKQNQPKELLQDVYSPESRDVWVKDGEVHTRNGLSAEISGLSGKVLQQYVYKKFTGSWWYLLFTPKDVYYYDTSSQIVEFITPIYDAGTVDVTNGSATVTGSGTTWSSELKAGDYFRIGGLNDANAVWYEIQSVDSDTQITLTTAYNEATATGQSYTVRKVFTTKDTDTWRVVQFTDANLGDIVAMTNQGGDLAEKVYYWDGTGQVKELSNSYPCKDLVVFKDRLILVQTYEGGAWQTQRYRWSRVADANDYTAAGTEGTFQDLPDTKGQLIGGQLLENGNYMILLKDDSKYLVRWVGGDYVFSAELVNLIGTYAINSLTVIPNIGLFYFGSDLHFRIFTGIQDVIIDNNVWNFVNNINPNNWGKIYAKYIDYNTQVRVFIPYGDSDYNDYCLVYNKAVSPGGSDYWIWHIWAYQKEQSLCSIGEFWNISDYYVDEDPWKDRYVDEWDGYWDSREYLENAPVVMYGGDDGVVRRADTGNTDDDVEYTPYFITKRLDFSDPFTEKRLWRVDPWLHSEAGKSVKISYRKNDKLSFEAYQKDLDISDTSREVVKDKVSINDYGSVFGIKISGTPPWRLIGLVCWWQPFNLVMR